MSSKVTPKQFLAIASLLEHGNVSHAAQDAGVARRTLQRWLRDDDFNQVLADTESQYLRLLAASMAANSGRAASVLMDIINSETSTNKEKISASRTYLSNLPSAQLLGRLLPALSRLEANDEPDDD